MWQKVHFWNLFVHQFSKDLEDQAFVLGGHRKADSRTIKCFNQPQLGLEHLPNRTIKLICCVLLRCGHSRAGIWDRSAIKRLLLLVTCPLQETLSFLRVATGRWHLPLQDVPQVRWPHCLSLKHCTEHYLSWYWQLWLVPRVYFFHGIYFLCQAVLGMGWCLKLILGNCERFLCMYGKIDSLLIEHGMLRRNKKIQTQLNKEPQSIHESHYHN